MLTSFFADILLPVLLLGLPVVSFWIILRGKALTRLAVYAVSLLAVAFLVSRIASGFAYRSADVDFSRRICEPYQVLVSRLVALSGERKYEQLDQVLRRMQAVPLSAYLNPQGQTNTFQEVVDGITR